VAGILLEKHREISASLDSVLDALEGGGTSAATRAFGSLAHRIRRHLELEDRRLLPVFEERTGLRDDGPTVMIRHEHREILARLSRIRTALRQAGGATEAAAQLRALRALLEDHTRGEEEVLDPTCDRLLDTAERRRTLRALARKGR